MTFEHELQTVLRHDAGQLTPAGRGPDAARRRAATRRRRQAVGATFAVAALVGAGGVAWLQRDDAVPIQAGAGGDGAQPDSAAVPDPAAPIQFSFSEADQAITAGRSAFYGSNGLYYVLSTAPGARWDDETPPAPAVYTSSDGLAWSSAVSEDTSLARLVEADGLLYAVGTAPVSGEPVVSVSSDSGQSWETQPLPSTAVVPPSATVDLTRSSSTGFAAGHGLLVAAVSTSYWPDMTSYVGPEKGWNVTDAGIEILDYSGLEEERMGITETAAPDADPAASTVPPTTMPPAAISEPEVVEVIPWSELGLNGPQDLQATELFVSSDGQHWESLASPFTAGTLANLVATPQGFLATTFDAGGMGMHAYRSADGRTWEAIDLGATWVRSAGVTGDKLVVVEDADQGGSPAIRVSADGGTSWTRTDVAAIAEPIEGRQRWIGAAGVGPLGVAAVIVDSDESGNATSQLVYSADLEHWTVVDLADFVDDTAWIDWLAVGADNLVFTVTDWNPEGGQQVSRTLVGVPTR